MYDKLGGELSSKHPVAMVNVERRMCTCRKEQGYGWIKGSYPVCVSKAYRKEVLRGFEDTLIETFWECIVKEVKRKHPEWVMEAFMLESRS